MASVEVTIDSGRLLARLQEMGSEQIVHEAAKIAFGRMQAVFLESQKQVPVDTGVLKNSGQLKEPEIDGASFRIAITYGGAASAYALYQHDNRALHHPPLRPRKGYQGSGHAGKAGFVIDPIRANAGNIATAIAGYLSSLGSA